jgi:hypothetical protein
MEMSIDHIAKFSYNFVIKQEGVIMQQLNQVLI